MIYANKIKLSVNIGFFRFFSFILDLVIFYKFKRKYRRKERI